MLLALTISYHRESTKFARNSVKKYLADRTMADSPDVDISQQTSDEDLPPPTTSSSGQQQQSNPSLDSVLLEDGSLDSVSLKDRSPGTMLHTLNHEFLRTHFCL